MLLLSSANGIKGDPSDLGYASSWLSYVFDEICAFIFKNWILAAFVIMGLAFSLVCLFCFIMDFYSKRNKKIDRSKYFQSRNTGYRYVIDGQRYFFNDKLTPEEESYLIFKSLRNSHSDSEAASDPDRPERRERQTERRSDRKPVNVDIEYEEVNNDE